MEKEILLKAKKSLTFTYISNQNECQSRSYDYNCKETKWIFKTYYTVK